MKHILASMLMCCAVAAAQACEPGLAAKMFVATNDQNNDGVLTASEWKNLDAGDFVIDFKLGEAGEFKRLDQNHNGKIEWQELIQAVHFASNPCQGWPWKE